MVIKENVCSHKFSDMSCKPIKFKKKCYCLCPFVRHDKFAQFHLLVRHDKFARFLCWE